MHRSTAAVLLACACAAYAKMVSVNEGLQLPKSLAISRSGGDLEKTSRNASPGVDPNASSELYYISPFGGDVPIAPHSNAIATRPPRYYKALHDYDNATLDIKSRLQFSAEALDDPNLSFITLAYVVDGLAVNVNKKGWGPYYWNYGVLVKSLIKRAERNPQGAVDEINCVLDAGKRGIQKIRKVMENVSGRLSCDRDATACDSLVDAIVKMSADDNLAQVADLLLDLGSAGANYLFNYAADFHGVPKSQVHSYLVSGSGKYAIRELVHKNMETRQGIFPYGDLCF